MDEDIAKKLKEVIALDKKWQPQIFMPQNYPFNLVDIVPFLHPTIQEKSSFVAQEFPNGASFHFYGFDGTEDAGRLIDTIKASAERKGTTLKARSRMRSFQNRKESIEFTCIKHHIYVSKSKQNFNDKCIQERRTISQPTHQAASIKGSRRSSKLKLVKTILNC